MATCGHRYQDCKALLGISSDLPPKAAIIVVFTGYSIRPQRGNARSERRTTARRKEVERRTKPGPSASGVWCLGRFIASLGRHCSFRDALLTGTVPWPFDVLKS